MKFQYSTVSIKIGTLIDMEPLRNPNLLLAEEGTASILDIYNMRRTFFLTEIPITDKTKRKKQRKQKQKQKPQAKKSPVIQLEDDPIIVHTGNADFSWNRIGVVHFMYQKDQDPQPYKLDSWEWEIYGRSNDKTVKSWVCWFLYNKLNVKFPGEIIELIALHAKRSFKLMLLLEDPHTTKTPTLHHSNDQVVPHAGMMRDLAWNKIEIVHCIHNRHLALTAFHKLEVNEWIDWIITSKNKTLFTWVNWFFTKKLNWEFPCEIILTITRLCSELLRREPTKSTLQLSHNPFRGGGGGDRGDHRRRYYGSDEDYDSDPDYYNDHDPTTPEEYYPDYDERRDPGRYDDYDDYDYGDYNDYDDYDNDS